MKFIQYSTEHRFYNFHSIFIVRDIFICTQFVSCGGVYVCVPWRGWNGWTTAPSLRTHNIRTHARTHTNHCSTSFKGAQIHIHTEHPKRKKTSKMSFEKLSEHKISLANASAHISYKRKFNSNASTPLRLLAAEAKKKKKKKHRRSLSRKWQSSVRIYKVCVRVRVCWRSTHTHTSALVHLLRI